MPYKDFKIEKVYYSIGEVAEMFDVANSLIRFWETEFDILKPRKNSKGNRLFTQKDIENLKLIYHLVKERGFTLEGARNELKSADKDELKIKAEIVNSLKNIRHFLDEMQEKL
ncbi:MAG: MerR family transcriptional regulator [Chitinophagales bacterium]|nr:MerR family transcriptional regulator [Chitinophagales bacterium]